MVPSPNGAGDWVKLHSRRLILAGGMEADTGVYPFSVTPGEAQAPPCASTAAELGSMPSQGRSTCTEHP